MTASARLISVVDAVCCVYFCAAGKSSLLLRVLLGLGMEILIPAEVEREVLGKCLGRTADQWPRLRASSRVRILDELTPTDARDGVVENVARLRGMSVQLALSARRDLGEAIVIGHATVLAAAGHEVYVIIDDQGGQILASNEGLTVLTVEDLLIAALRLGLLPPAKLRRTYEDLLPFGSGLPTWDASDLKRKYSEWRRSRQQQGSEAWRRSQA
ncbi:MAG TPA: hypothetical protein VHX38_19770 [Pseudonocardiaceae bacterium]|jgi:hypothetical protein|nr:hypothetical protein [Pseudonocardiaceae bacterium]